MDRQTRGESGERCEQTWEITSLLCTFALTIPSALGLGLILYHGRRVEILPTQTPSHVRLEGELNTTLTNSSCLSRPRRSEECSLFHNPRPPTPHMHIFLLWTLPVLRKHELFLWIIHPICNPPTNDPETLTSPLRLTDKYDVKAVLDPHNNYVPSTRVGPPSVIRDPLQPRLREGGGCCCPRYFLRVFDIPPKPSTQLSVTRGWWCSQSPETENSISGWSAP